MSQYQRPIIAITAPEAALAASNKRPSMGPLYEYRARANPSATQKPPNRAGCDPLNSSMMNFEATPTIAVPNSALKKTPINVISTLQWRIVSRNVTLGQCPLWVENGHRTPRFGAVIAHPSLRSLAAAAARAGNERRVRVIARPRLERAIARLAGIHDAKERRPASTFWSVGPRNSWPAASNCRAAALRSPRPSSASPQSIRSPPQAGARSAALR